MTPHDFPVFSLHPLTTSIKPLKWRKWPKYCFLSFSFRSLDTCTKRSSYKYFYRTCATQQDVQKEQFQTDWQNQMLPAWCMWMCECMRWGLAFRQNVLMLFFIKGGYWTKQTLHRGKLGNLIFSNFGVLLSFIHQWTLSKWHTFNQSIYIHPINRYMIEYCMKKQFFQNWSSMQKLTHNFKIIFGNYICKVKAIADSYACYRNATIGDLFLRDTFRALFIKKWQKI